MLKNKWVKKGDKVLVIAGNDRGKVGEVMARKNDRVLVQGVNIRKKHMKSRDQSRKSEIIDMELPIHISNVALCGVNKKKLKLFVRLDEDHNKTLSSLVDGKEARYRTLRKSHKR